MTLRGARVARNPLEAERLDVSIARGRIARFGERRGSAYDLSGYLLLPGLINAHDHLEFALFPRLGRGTYPNATNWARDIYHPARSPICEHLRVPKRVRLYWGGLRNLLSGVTLVSHHNPFDAAVFNRRFPVRVLRRYGWSHSLAFSPDLRRHYARTPADWPFIVHAAEGVDTEARSEVTSLAQGGMLAGRTVIVHGVAMDSRELDLMRSSRSALVCCPSSNFFTLGTTVPPKTFRCGFPVALGTDSPLTAAGDLADEIQIARSRMGLSAEEIYAMVTTRAAQVLRLGGGHGDIAEGGVADLIAVPDRGQTPAEALFALDPHMVMIAGQIRLLADPLARRLGSSALPRGYPVSLQSRGRWVTDVNVPLLHSTARQALGGPVFLAGKAVQ